MKQGIIFNMQKFSIHDGPGIRTTVFLKGCPLRCKWCANPESQLGHIQVLYDVEKCQHCRYCINICPKRAMKYVDDHVVIDHSKCIGCLKCVSSCPGKALKKEGERKSVEEVVNYVLQDQDFYEESGGGVTISGGEGMSQPDFLNELIPALKEHNLHVAIETTGFVPSDTFKKLAPHFDLLLFDVKHANSKKHQEGTGVKNELITENLKWAVEEGLEILPRIPVIPGFNETLEDAHDLAIHIKECGLTKVQLLPFHQFGENKYKLLNQKYELEDVKALYPEDLKDYQQVFLDEGLDCFF